MPEHNTKPSATRSTARAIACYDDAGRSLRKGEGEIAWLIYSKILESEAELDP